MVSAASLVFASAVWKTCLSRPLTYVSSGSGALFPQKRYLRDPSGIYGKVSWSGLRIPWYHGESHVPVHWLLLRCVLFVRPVFLLFPGGIFSVLLPALCNGQFLHVRFRW